MAKSKAKMQAFTQKWPGSPKDTGVLKPKKQKKVVENSTFIPKAKVPKQGPIYEVGDNFYDPHPVCPATLWFAKNDTYFGATLISKDEVIPSNIVAVLVVEGTLNKCAYKMEGTLKPGGPSPEELADLMKQESALWN